MPCASVGSSRHGSEPVAQPRLRLAAIEFRCRLEHVELAMQHFVDPALPVVEIAGDDQWCSLRHFATLTKSIRNSACRTRLRLIRPKCVLIRCTSSGALACFEVRYRVQQPTSFERVVRNVVIQMAADRVARNDCVAMMAVRDTPRSSHTLDASSCRCTRTSS